MTTLVTGVTGFVGSAVARCLLDAGHDVRALVRPDSNRANLAGLALDIVVGDLRDRESLDRAVAGCDSLFHIAADYRLWARRTQDLYEANVDGSINVLRAAGDAGVSRIVYTSSVATIGIGADGSPSTEDTPVGIGDMVGHYKRSKFIAEHEVRVLAKRERLPVVIVNPSTPLGPRDIRPTPTGRMVAQAAVGRIPAFVDTGLNLVHVEDVAEGHLQAFNKGELGERYILGGENWTLHRILTEIAALTGRSAPKLRLPYAAVLPLAHATEVWAKVTRAKREPMLTVDGLRMSRKHMFFSSDKARERLGYNPRPAQEALQDSVRWFKERR